MGKFKGKILLDKKKIKAVMERLRKDERIPSSVQEELWLIGRMATWYVNMAERAAQYRGQFEEYYPWVAQRICEYFAAGDEDLAEIFFVQPRTIANWRALYPEFEEAISYGRKRFNCNYGWNRWYRGWLHPYLAHALCVVFNATDDQIAHGLGVDSETFTAWKMKFPELSAAIRHGRRTVLVNSTLHELEQIIKRRAGANIPNEDIKTMLCEFNEVFERLSMPAVSDMCVRHRMNEIYRILEDEKGTEL